MRQPNDEARSDDPLMMMQMQGLTDNSSRVSASDSLEHTVAAAHMLRSILEDYLEVDASADAYLHDLLQPEVLVQYFHRVHVEEAELVFDADQRADKVLKHSTMSSIHYEDGLNTL